MFYPLAHRDIVIMLRGLFVLIFVIVVGLTVAEGQLNTLTQWDDNLHRFSISCNSDGIYSIYILGVSYHLQAVYVVGEIITTEQTIMIKTSQHSISIPIRFDIDCRKELIFLDSWVRKIETQANKYKQILGLYTTIIQEKLNVYVQ